MQLLVDEFIQGLDSVATESILWSIFIELDLSVFVALPWLIKVAFLVFSDVVLAAGLSPKSFHEIIKQDLRLAHGGSC